MITKNLIFSAIGFILITFSLAPLWHIILFEEQYQQTGLYSGNPNYIIGFITIITQSIVLSVTFHYLYLKLKIPPYKFILFAGLFLWSMQVLAVLAKSEMTNPRWFFVMETVFIIIQLGLFIILLKIIYKVKYYENS